MHEPISKSFQDLCCVVTPENNHKSQIQYQSKTPLASVLFPPKAYFFLSFLSNCNQNITYIRDRIDESVFSSKRLPIWSILSFYYSAHLPNRIPESRIALAIEKKTEHRTLVRGGEKTSATEKQVWIGNKAAVWQKGLSGAEFICIIGKTCSRISLCWKYFTIYPNPIVGM